MLNRFTGTAERKGRTGRGECLSSVWATPAEIADAIVFVASRKASFISGQIISVNGGQKPLRNFIPGRRPITKLANKTAPRKWRIVRLRLGDGRSLRQSHQLPARTLGTL